MTDRPDAAETTGLAGYKSGVDTTTRVFLEWRHDLVFAGQTPRGYDLDFDAKAEEGCKPTDALLHSLAGCMAIDIVSILTKMRTPPASFRMEARGERNPDPPQFFRKVELVLHLAGEGLEPARVERAIELSRRTYCSVFNSLRPDLEMVVSYHLA